MASRHIPPSRQRYEAANPTIATRIDRALYLALTEIAESGAKSLGEVVRDALNEYIAPEPPESEDDVVTEPTHGPEAHPEYVELTAEVDRLRAERSRLQQAQYQTQVQLQDVVSKQSAVQDNADRAKARLTKMAGPLGMHEYCLHCRYPWHEHTWKGLTKSWLCPRD